MFFDFFGDADKNGDGKVDMWEAAEKVYAFDFVMGTNFTGAFPEHDEKEPEEDYDIDEECDKLYDNEYLGDVFDDDEDYDEDEDYDDEDDEDYNDDEYDCDSDDCDEW